MVPGPLVAVTVGSLINLFLGHYYPEIALRGDHLVSLPVANSAGELLSYVTFPDFARINDSAIYLTALTIAVIGSLETLLCVEAIDKLDPEKRVTPTNRELVAQGVANASCGLIGGLPVTQVIVRSSANLQSGAKSKMSAIVHGFLLLATVILIPQILNVMPLASLAAVLLIVGYKLAKPELFKKMYSAGPYQFIPFIGTIIGLVLTDLLIGIGIGVAISLFCILLENYKIGLEPHREEKFNKTYLRLPETVSFLNKVKILGTLGKLPDHSSIVIDASDTRYIDFDVFETIQNFKVAAERKNISLIIENLPHFGSISPAEKLLPHDQETQRALTPSIVLEKLKTGNTRFVHNLMADRNMFEQINITRNGQFPMAIILSCIDSRTSAELIFDQGLGDIFSTRIAGNVVNDDIIGSMEYACKFSGSKLIVVLGHTHCGAIKGVCDGIEFEHLTGLLDKIKPAVESVKSEAVESSNDQDKLMKRVAERNVELVVQRIRDDSPALEAMSINGEIGIVGGMYDVETGKVDFFLDSESQMLETGS